MVMTCGGNYIKVNRSGLSKDCEENTKPRPGMIMTVVGMIIRLMGMTLKVMGMVLKVMGMILRLMKCYKSN